MKLAYIDPFCGASGDMILGALIDAGAPIGEIHNQLAKLHLGKFQIKTRRTQRGGLTALKLDVATQIDRTGRRDLASILKMIKASRLPSAVIERSAAVFRNLAKAESAAHGREADSVHFHEIGDLDSIVDIVGTCIALEILGVERLFAGEIPVGCGEVRCSHGILPVPAPATSFILRGWKVKDFNIDAELTTPTGAALITTLCRFAGEMPSMQLESVGVGAGERAMQERPNILRVFVGESVPKAREDEEVWVVETNIDDMSPQLYQNISEKLFRSGALDVFFTPVQMKKQRPGILISVIVPARQLAAIEKVLFTESTTFGLRKYRTLRTVLAREMRQVKTPFGKVRVKIGRLRGEIITASPEYSDCARLARKAKVALKIVLSAASQAASKLSEASRR
jgi:hypothetical protein